MIGPKRQFIAARRSGRFQFQADINPHYKHALWRSGDQAWLLAGPATAPGPGIAAGGHMPRMIMPSTSSLVTSAVRAVPTTAAVLHDTNAVREIEHVVNVVADKEDADARPP